MAVIVKVYYSHATHLVEMSATLMSRPIVNVVLMCSVGHLNGDRFLAKKTLPMPSYKSISNHVSLVTVLLRSLSHLADAVKLDSQ